MKVNPYESPTVLSEAPSASQRPPGVSLAASTGYVLIMTGAGAALGSVLGLAIGILMPGYYRAVLPGGSAAGFDPVLTGMILGLTQGLGGGAVLGVAILAVYFWYLTRLRRIT
jgi:hypothetical protein